MADVQARVLERGIRDSEQVRVVEDVQLVSILLSKVEAALSQKCGPWITPPANLKGRQVDL